MLHVLLMEDEDKDHISYQRVNSSLNMQLSSVCLLEQHLTRY